MILERSEHPSWLSNTWIVAARPGGSAVIVDAGGPIAPVLDAARRHALTVTHILLTHHHGDHVLEREALRRATGARTAAHRLDADRIGRVDLVLEEGPLPETGDLFVRGLHIPGHTAGQMAYVVNETVCFTGDTLFRGSIGSVRDPDPDAFASLKRSLVERLLGLPDAMLVAPGHTAPTTIGDERRDNPFLRVMTGRAPEGTARGIYDGDEVQLVVWARDYDLGFKAWIRTADGRDHAVPGSRVTRIGP
jgi:glyoxylase-like metal-dependent hydrolase (beta-lactamase superfamily II)